jgi:hypothetical protein
MFTVYLRSSAFAAPTPSHKKQILLVSLWMCFLMPACALAQSPYPSPSSPYGNTATSPYAGSTSAQNSAQPKVSQSSLGGTYGSKNSFFNKYWGCEKLNITTIQLSSVESPGSYINVMGNSNIYACGGAASNASTAYMVSQVNYGGNPNSLLLTRQVTQSDGYTIHLYRVILTVDGNILSWSWINDDGTVSSPNYYRRCATVTCSLGADLP